MLQYKQSIMWHFLQWQNISCACQRQWWLLTATRQSVHRVL